MFPSPPFISMCKQTNNIIPGLTEDQRKVNIDTCSERLLKLYEHGVCAPGVSLSVCFVLSFTKCSFGTGAPFFRDLFFKAPRLLLLLFPLFRSLSLLTARDTERQQQTA